MIPVDDEACSNRDDANEDSEKTTQAHCHTLVTNACVLWTTKYLGLAIDDTEDAVSDEVIAPLSPAQFQSKAIAELRQRVEDLEATVRELQAA